ncbi:hypothetical protein FACS1894177_09220 [Bacteroidia bacterium]|nr:hypothetical protein FACS1894177_09220 [Bacteroidia bacterium]
MCIIGSDNEITLDNNVFLPPDFFDVIIVDECHRSIYGRWQQVLNYFGRDAACHVSTLRTETEREALTNLIQLVRYAFQIIPELKSRI